MLFVACLISAGILNSKLIEVFGYTFAGGIIVFPLSFILGDILTEVYGYKETRKIVWGGFAIIIFFTLITQIAINIPGAAFYTDQTSFEKVLGSLPRTVFAGIVAYLCGEYTNSVVLSKLKIYTQGKMLWARTIGSTIAGEGVDTILFCLIAFYGVFANEVLVTVIISGYVFKVCYEIIATPIIYKIIAKVKQVEELDTYDHGVQYKMFSLK
jgi:uncharacterized integral membrane protein (TIGR00697 family)